ncbi:hypothetical protein MZD04_gp121 [Pseudomonas phage Psa21]|uniref:Uncharacterized protein n=1 Tax=Pseudomonas phage Psa21 TaxID=2530023 RepID=A0A481W4D2_9CAUD|nr:hypothetical protein MZD04_gp121 [Pseudomonas phage Psa21]QBJ02649.1 hypothetical protein PSA21_121 [Pseudomonas phage Psa21]
MQALVVSLATRIVYATAAGVITHYVVKAVCKDSSKLR